MRFAEKLVACGVASHTDRPGLMENVPFTVVESKKSGLRQRFILWTKQANEELIKVGYKADVPLEEFDRVGSNGLGAFGSCPTLVCILLFGFGARGSGKLP